MSELNKKRLLVFHTIVAPYRVDFFNNLAIHYDMFMCLDRKVVYGGLFKDIEKLYSFEYEEDNSTKGIRHTYRFVYRYIKEKEPDIIMVSECGQISLIVVLIKLFCRRKFAVVSIVDDSYDQITEGRQFSRKHVWAEKILFPQFDQIINVDERVSRLFQHKYGKGVPFPIIRDETIYRDNLKLAIPLSEDYMKRYSLYGRKIVLYVGRFVKLKNIPALIRAFNILGDDSATLILVGSGEEEQPIKEICENENIIFTGALSGLSLYAWYNIADVFVLPSLVETFGAVTNEALMAGCKCLITERAGSSCLIKKGINGDCFNPIIIDDLKDKLSMLLQNNNDSSIEHDKLAGIRPSLMQTTFKQEMDKLLLCLDRLS